jgi:DNA-binding SARP family transcriptional activator
VRLRLLGGFRLDVGGRSADWYGVRPRVLVLLRLLAVTPDLDVHRERLVDALWPGVGLPTGTHRLQVAVSSLRAALDRAGLSGSAVLARHGEAYRLSLPPQARVDVRDLLAELADASAARAQGRTAAAATAARRALSLYPGELLPEDGPAEWVVPERGRLRRCVAMAAGEFAEDCLRLGELKEGLDAAHRALEFDRYQDRFWELLAELHERAGDRAAAARARQEHAQALAELCVPGLARIGPEVDQVIRLPVQRAGPPRGVARGPA